MGIKKNQVGALPGGSFVQAIEGWTQTDFYSAPSAVNFQFSRPFSIGSLFYVDNALNGYSDGPPRANPGAPRALFGAYDNANSEGHMQFLYDVYGTNMPYIVSYTAVAGGVVVQEVSQQTGMVQAGAPGRLVFVVDTVNTTVDTPQTGRPANSLHTWLNGKFSNGTGGVNSAYPYGQTTYDTTLSTGDISAGVNKIDTTGYPAATLGMGMLGMFYTNQALSDLQIEALFAAVRGANNMRDLDTPILDYWWSADDNPGTTWASKGNLTSFDLVRTGAPLTLVESTRTWG